MHVFCTDDQYMNITLNLGRPESTPTKSANKSAVIQEWWIVNQTRSGEIKSTFMTPGKSGLELYVFSDKVSPPSLGFLAGYG